MKRRRAALAIIILCSILAACGKSNSSSQGALTAPDLSTVALRISSGGLSPDLAWEEVYTLSGTGLTFVRTAYTDLSPVNSGAWQVNSYGANEATLFAKLAGPAVYNVVKTGNGLTPAGGELRDYMLFYADNSAREIVIGDGSRYSDSDLISKPVDSYISAVVLPAGAGNRYR